MKLLTKMSLMACLLMFSFSCTPESLDEDVALKEASMVIPETKKIETKILELINDYRQSKGLNILSNMSVIKAQAFTHTGYMVDVQKMSHDNFFKRSKYLKANANAKEVSENVAYGFTSANSVVNAWLKSNGHRVNIEGDYTNFDISAEKDENGIWYFTNIFIKK